MENIFLIDMFFFYMKNFYFLGSFSAPTRMWPSSVPQLALPSAGWGVVHGTLVGGLGPPRQQAQESNLVSRGVPCSCLCYSIYFSHLHKTLNKAIEANSPGPRLLSLGGKDLRHSMACHRLYLGDRQSSWEQARMEMKSPQRQAQALYARGLTGLREGT